MLSCLQCPYSYLYLILFCVVILKKPTFSFCSSVHLQSTTGNNAKDQTCNGPASWGWLPGHGTCADTGSLPVRRALHLLYYSAVAVLKFWMIFLTRGLLNKVAGSIFNLNHLVPDVIPIAWTFFCPSLYKGKPIRASWDLKYQVSSCPGTCMVSPQVCEPILYS